jgi:hypothetical protein
MDSEASGWKPCSSCKGDIDFGQAYYVCDVPTCNRGGTDFRFCSIECWDAHVPVMRHRNPSALEKRAPSQAEWERELAKEAPPAEPSRPRAESRAASGPAGGEPELAEQGLPRDVLVVVSKLKAYVRARSGMNTSDAVMEVLSDRLRALCDEAIRNAARDGRKTVLDRDVRAIRS